MQILITLIATQIISTIIALSDYQEPKQIVALSLDLAGMATLLLLIRMKQKPIFQRAMLLCLATVIFILMPNQQYKFYTAVFNILFRLAQQAKLSKILLIEEILLLTIIFIFGTEIEIHQIFRSIFTLVGLVLCCLFYLQNQIEHDSKKPSIVVHSKIQYTLPDASNPKSLTERLQDFRISILTLDEQLNLLNFNKQASVLRLAEDGLENLLLEIKIKKIDSKSKAILQIKHQQLNLKSILDEIKAYGSPLIVYILDFTHPYFSDHLIKIIYQNDFEIHFVDLEERDQCLKKNYVYEILKQLFSTMSHEFGTSLNYILAIAQVAIEKYQIDSVLQQYFETIRSIGQIMHHFVLDMVDYNDFLGKKLKLQLQKTDIKLVLDEVLSIFSFSLKSKQLYLTYEIEMNDNIILTDIRRLKQILITLVQNAQKFTLSGGIQIFVKSVQQDKFVQFEIKDTGIGLTSTELENLTEMLSTDIKKKKKISNNTAGFGLGSYLCNKIAMSLSNLTYPEGGGIRYYSNQEGKGTTVTFKIKNEPFNLTYSLTAGSENSSGLLQVHKNAVIDLKQSQMELGLSGMKKPLTSRFSTTMFPKVKSMRSDSIKETYLHKQTTKDIFKNIQGLKVSWTDNFQRDEASVNEETNELEFQRRLQVQTYKCNYHPSDLLKELRQNSIQVSEDYLQNCNCNTILIVDDEMINILGLQLMLKTFNLEADFAFNGQEALKKLESSHCMYNYIFMDINMPIMDGFTATKAIIQKYKIGSPSIIACTAFTDSDTKQRCYEIGMKFYLTKPVSKMELQKMLNFIQIKEIEGQN